MIDLETTFGNQMEEDGEGENVLATGNVAVGQQKEAQSEELDADGNPILTDDDDDDDEISPTCLWRQWKRR